jgi:hypothetical protein
MEGFGVQEFEGRFRLLGACKWSVMSAVPAHLSAAGQGACEESRLAARALHCGADSRAMLGATVLQLSPLRYLHLTWIP